MLEPAEGVAAAHALAVTAARGRVAHDLDAAWWVGGTVFGAMTGARQ